MNQLAIKYGNFLYNLVLLMLLLSPLLLSCHATQTKSQHADNSTFARLAAQKKKISQKDPDAMEAYKHLIIKANAVLSKGPYSVMHKTTIPPSGSKHDYLSIAPYFWPNSSTPDSLPYIRKDGEINPGARNNKTDYNEKERFFNAISLLGQAFLLSEEPKYAAKCDELLRAWFLDSATFMHPNLNYGQGIPGISNGRSFGIIEFGSIGNLINTMEQISHYGGLTIKTYNGVKQWITQYANWLQHSEIGTAEATRSNNHATTYDRQLYRILLFLGDTGKVVNLLENVTKPRIAQQIAPDGRQPHELSRTKAFGYSTMNLATFTQLAILGKKLGVDLWDYQSEDGRSIKKAYAFLIPYLSANKKWEYMQITSLSSQKRRFAHLLEFAGKEFDEPQFVKIADSYLQKNTSKEHTHE